MRTILVAVALHAALAAQGLPRETLLGVIRSRDGGDPAGLTVHLLHRAHAVIDDPGFEDRVTCVSGEHGRFRAQLLPGRPYLVWAIGPLVAGSYRCTDVATEVVAGTTLTLTEGARRHLWQVRFAVDPSWIGSAHAVAVAEIGGLQMRAELPIDGFDGVVSPAWPVDRIRIDRCIGDHPVGSTTVTTTEASHPLQKPCGARADLSLWVGSSPTTPLAGVELWAETGLTRRLLGTSDAHGTLTVPLPESVRDLPTDCVLRAEGFAERAYSARRPAFGRALPVAQLARAATVRGRLLFDENEPLVSVPILLEACVIAGRNSWSFTTPTRPFVTDENGGFAIPGRLHQHAFRLCALLDAATIERLSRDPDAAPLWPVALLRSERAEEPEDVGDLRLARLRTLDITVRSADGTPPGAMTIVAQPIMGTAVVGTQLVTAPYRPEFLHTDRHGRLRWIAAAGTDIALWITTPDAGGFALADATATRVEIVMDPAHKLRLRLVDDAGRPIAGATFRMGGALPGETTLALSDAIGRMNNAFSLGAFEPVGIEADAHGELTIVVPMLDVYLQARVRTAGKSHRVQFLAARDRDERPIEVLVSAKND